MEIPIMKKDGVQVTVHDHKDHSVFVIATTTDNNLQSMVLSGEQAIQLQEKLDVAIADWTKKRK